MEVRGLVGCWVERKTSLVTSRGKSNIEEGGQELDHFVSRFSKSYVTDLVGVPYSCSHICHVLTQELSLPFDLACITTVSVSTCVTISSNICLICKYYAQSRALRSIHITPSRRIFISKRLDSMTTDLEYSPSRHLQRYSWPSTICWRYLIGL